MSAQHCLIAQLPQNDHPSPEIVSTCVLGCMEAACCFNTEGGEKYYMCLAQMRKRLGGEPEPGDKCGSCGIEF